MQTSLILPDPIQSYLILSNPATGTCSARILSRQNMEPDQGLNFPEWFDFIAAIDKPGNFCGFGLSVILTDFKILFGHLQNFYISFGSHCSTVWLWQFLTLLNAGGGLEEPPLSYKCGSSKNAQRKSCQFFVTFPKYMSGVLETTFCNQTTFGQAGRGQKWSKSA